MQNCFVVFLLGVFAFSVEGVVYSVSNKAITVGIDSAFGGAISLLLDNNVPSLNLINCHDEGRLIQQSYYAGPDPYRNASWSGHPWAWNPISAGDCHGHASTILTVNSSQDTSTIYVKTRPLQWALDNVPCNCTFETFITLDENGFFVANRLQNFRADHNDYGVNSQELPAVYTIGKLSELWTYNGTAPWSGGNLSQVDYMNPNNGPWRAFSATENWAAFTEPVRGSQDHYGVGVMHTGIQSFLGGFAGVPGKGTDHDGDTGYIAPVGREDLTWNIEFVWCYKISVGYLETIRDYFAARRSTPCLFPNV